MSGLHKYDLARKHAFRRWAWSRLKEWSDLGKEQKSVQARRAPYFYLLGPDPQDWRVAGDYGIGRDRLVGVDSNPELVARARKQGLWAVEGDLADVLLFWCRPVAGVLADFCCNYRLDYIAHLWFAMAAVTGHSGCHVPAVINVQRGRENTQNFERVSRAKRQIELAQKGELQDCPSHIQRIIAKWPARPLTILQDVAMAASKNVAEYDEAVNYLVEMAQPYSYQSHVVTMDAIVIPTCGANLHPGKLIIPKVTTSTSRRVAALKAMRTQQGLAA